MGQGGSVAQGGLEDGVMAVLRLEDGALAQIHAAYTVRHAPTAVEVYGTTGAIVARDVLTQRPAGEIWLRDEAGERPLPVKHEDLYVRAVARFLAAIRGDGAPAATAEDGLRALAGALAVAESCRTGRTCKVQLGGRSEG